MQARLAECDAVSEKGHEQRVAVWAAGHVRNGVGQRAPGWSALVKQIGESAPARRPAAAGQGLKAAFCVVGGSAYRPGTCSVTSCCRGACLDQQGRESRLGTGQADDVDDQATQLRGAVVGAGVVDQLCHHCEGGMSTARPIGKPCAGEQRRALHKADPVLDAQMSPRRQPG